VGGDTLKTVLVDRGRRRAELVLPTWADDDESCEEIILLVDRPITHSRGSYAVVAFVVIVVAPPTANTSLFASWGFGWGRAGISVDQVSCDQPSSPLLDGRCGEPASNGTPLVCFVFS
jgi:hypothetical protein